MTDRDGRTLQEQLLAKILDECMEEQMSFVPPEREIARLHRFSPRFQKQMEELCRTKGKPEARRMEKREFIYGFNKAAACVLAVLMIGGLGYLGLGLLGPDGFAGAGKTSGADMVKESAAEDTGSWEEAEEESAEVTEEAAAAEEPGSPTEEIPEAEFLRRRLEPAPEQEVPTELGNVRTLVNSPRIARDAQEILVTIGNMEEYPIYYYQHMDLEVKIGGFWYLLQPDTPPSEEVQRNMIMLEPGMAQDETILLSDYTLDCEAEGYRIVTYLDGMTLSSEFRFEDEERLGEELFGEEEGE